MSDKLKDLEQEVDRLPDSEKIKFAIALAAITHAMRTLSPETSGLLLMYIVATMKAVEAEQR